MPKWNLFLALGYRPPRALSLTLLKPFPLADLTAYAQHAGASFSIGKLGWLGDASGATLASS